MSSLMFSSTSTIESKSPSVVRHAAVSSIGRGQSGFTLVEIIVAVLILAVGILGVAGLQSVGVRESQNTYFRSQANLLVIEMANRMRANQEQAYLGEDSVYRQSFPSSASCDYGSNSGCNDSDLAQLDMLTWATAVQNSGLPNPGQAIEFVGEIEVEGVAVTSIYDIQVFWDESRENQSAENCAAASGCVSWRVQI